MEKASKSTAAASSAITNEVNETKPTTSKSEKTISKKRSIDSVMSTAKIHATELTKKTKTIQDDPNASETFKSLFTSSDRAKNQQKAHWVTFNPQYF